MKCECGYPIPLQNRVIKEGFGMKEIPNIVDYFCPMCGKKHKLKSLQGKITVINKS